MEEVQSYRNRIKQLEDDLLFRLSNSQARHHGIKVVPLGFEADSIIAHCMLSICSPRQQLYCASSLMPCL